MIPLCESSFKQSQLQINCKLLWIRSKTFLEIKPSKFCHWNTSEQFDYTIPFQERKKYLSGHNFFGSLRHFMSWVIFDLESSAEATTVPSDSQKPGDKSSIFIISNSTTKYFTQFIANFMTLIFQKTACDLFFWEKTFAPVVIFNSLRGMIPSNPLLQQLP